MIINLVVLIFILQAHSAEIGCETEPNDPKIQEIISILKAKWQGVWSSQVKYTIFYNDTGKKEQRQCIFMSHKDSFYYAFTCPVSKIILDERPKDENLNNPKNLLERLIIQSSRYEKENKSISHYELFTYAYYYHKGNLSIRQIFLSGNNRKIYSLPSDIGIGELIVYGDPRILWGGMRYAYDESLQSPWPLFRFFEENGKFYYKESGDYRILWHEIPSKNHEFSTSLEVWINSDDNISRLRNVHYFGRTYTLEEIKKAETIIENNITCDFPEVVVEDILFSDFHPVYKIPLKMEQIRFSPQCKDSNIFEELRDKTITLPEYQAKLSLCPWIKTLEIILLIERESLKINEPIDERLFIADIADETIGTGNNANKKTTQIISLYKKYSWILFVIVSITFVLLLIIVTKRFFSWGI